MKLRNCQAGALVAITLVILLFDCILSVNGDYTCPRCMSFYERCRSWYLTHLIFKCPFWCFVHFGCPPRRPIEDQPNPGPESNPRPPQPPPTEPPEPEKQPDTDLFTFYSACLSLNGKAKQANCGFVTSSRTMAMILEKGERILRTDGPMGEHQVLVGYDPQNDSKFGTANIIRGELLKLSDGSSVAKYTFMTDLADDTFSVKLLDTSNTDSLEGVYAGVWKCKNKILIGMSQPTTFKKTSKMTFKGSTNPRHNDTSCKPTDKFYAFRGKDILQERDTPSMELIGFYVNGKVVVAPRSMLDLSRKS